MKKTIEETYKILSDVEHVRKRIGMYVGSPVREKFESYVFENEKMVSKTLNIVPAFIKIVSEILDNSVDEHKRNASLNTLKVSIKKDEIIIWDNGGIPVEKHAEYDMYVPEIIFGQLRSGANYNDNDNQALAGTNGIGSKAVNILSSHFIVETSDGIHSFKQEFFDGMTKRSKPLIKPCDKHYTKITFKPDYSLFGMTCLDEDHILRIKKRLYDISATNPKLKVYFENDLINIKSFKEYIGLYSDQECVYDENDKWKIGLISSSGYEQTSFVNCIETYNGGSHVDYIVSQITTALREYFKKKHKVDVKPNDIKSHIHIFIDCEINRPKFSSQTKENMISAVSDFGSSFTVSEKFIKKIISSSVIQSVLDWVSAKALAEEAKAIRNANKENNKTDPRRIENFSDAMSRDEREKCILFLTEGLSAVKSIQTGRGKNPYIGAFPLKGKVLNVRDCSTKDIIDNVEIQKIIQIMGLNIGDEVKFEEQKDGEWLEISIDGCKRMVNINDEINIKGIWYKVQDLIKE